MKFFFGATDIIVTYNDYAEIRTEAKNIAQSIQDIGISQKYKVTVNNQPVTIAGAMPDVVIEFVKHGSDNYEEVFMRLSLDAKVFRLQYIANDALGIDTYKKALDELMMYFENVWLAFDSVASRQIIERVGLVSFAISYDTDEPNIFAQEIDYDLYALRLITKEDEIGVFKNTSIIKNFVVEPDFTSEGDVKQIKLINDIAMPPSSKGVVEKDHLADGVRYLADLSLKNLKENETWVLA